ncbi:PepSY domain-containing protein [Candidatus Woesearchaeota archaeon]|nr:PepSY domain-containing protein [Candidatus Woesearchaeota archaeon]
MNVREIIERLEASAEFLLWKDEHHDAFLMSIFSMFDSESSDDYLVSYFEGMTVTTFYMDAKETYKKGVEESEKPIKQLDITNLGVELKQAVSTARAAFLRKSGESIAKTIAILQNLDDGPLWNISFMSSNYNVYNARINAETGQLVSEDYGAMFRQA